MIGLWTVRVMRLIRSLRHVSLCHIIFSEWKFALLGLSRELEKFPFLFTVASYGTLVA